jgi:RNA polymerase sigma-70 factor, ECF subfamily
VRDPDGRARFEDLYRAHYAEILRYAARRVDLDTARDVAADTFTAAWRRLDDVPAHAARAWLFTTARNVLVNQYRAVARRERLADRIRSIDPAADEPDHAQRVADRLHAHQLLGQLADDAREALELIEWEGLTPAQAARVVGCSAATFRVRLHRARRHLAALYEQDRADPIALIPQRCSS